MNLHILYTPCGFVRPHVWSTRCSVRAACANCRAVGSRWTASISAVPERSGPRSWDAARGPSGKIEVELEIELLFGMFYVMFELIKCCGDKAETCSFLMIEV